jgi:hypothetical protein
MMGQRKPDDSARKRAMVRLNGMMFYSIGIASFLESTAPLDTARLLRLAEGEADIRAWLEQQWLPGRAEQGRQFRDYIETTWQEFDWSPAYQEFRECYAARAAARVGPPGLALEFVSRCVTETTLTVFYRTLAKCAEEPELRDLARDAERTHAGYFNYFRAAFERLGGRKRAGLARSCRALLASCHAAREVDVAAAFHPLGRHWHGGWVFPELSYPEFLARLANLIRHHAALGPIERLLFRPWLNPPRNVEAPARPAAAASGGRKSAGGPAVPKVAEAA